MRFKEEKTKSILYASKRKIKSARKLNTKYKDIKMKQQSQVTNPGFILDETLSGEPMTLKALNKINGIQYGKLWEYMGNFTAKKISNTNTNTLYPAKSLSQSTGWLSVKGCISG